MLRPFTVQGGHKFHALVQHLTPGALACELLFDLGVRRRLVDGDGRPIVGADGDGDARRVVDAPKAEEHARHEERSSSHEQQLHVRDRTAAATDRDGHLMGNRIACFWLEPTGLYRLGLRRFARATGAHYHDAEVEIGDAEEVDPVTDDDHPHDDPRWPARCACGYLFAATDPWQRTHERLFRRADTGELLTLGEGPSSAPAGAMWNAPWYAPAYVGSDGRSIVVRTPDGDWLVDAPPSANGARWVREGEPPRLTVRPSILFYKRDGSPGYHAFLTDGVLEEC